MYCFLIVTKWIVIWYRILPVCMQLIFLLNMYCLFPLSIFFESNSCKNSNILYELSYINHIMSSEHSIKFICPGCYTHIRIHFYLVFISFVLIEILSYIHSSHICNIDWGLPFYFPLSSIYISITFTTRCVTCIQCYIFIQPKLSLSIH